MTTVEAMSVAQLDAALDTIVREREWTLARATGLDRAVRLAELYQLEARLWSTLFEQVRTRLYWRAALGAEAHARRCAEYWRSIAAQHSVDVTAWPAQIAEAV